MTAVIIRTIIVYISLMIAMRLMGKRQLGELEVSELITTLLLSEIATMPIVDTSVPILHAIVPIAMIISFEIILSEALIRAPKMRSILTSKPSVLISHGVIDEAQLKKARMSVDELISSLRLKDVTSPIDVQFAILESNGQLSVVQEQPPKAGNMMYLLISDGQIYPQNLKLAGKGEGWLDAVLKEKGLRRKDVFCFMSDGRQNLYLQEKRRKRGCAAS